MSARTKYMTHFYNAFSGFIELEEKASGLADLLYSGVKELSNEVGLNNLLVEFDKAMVELEAKFKDKIPIGETLSGYCPSLRVRKSNLRSAIKAGIDPRLHATYNAFVKAKDEKKGTNGSGANKPATKEPTSNGGTNVSVLDVPKDIALFAALPSDIKEHLRKAVRLLAQLDEETASAVVKNFEGAIHSKLKKLGARGHYANKKVA